MVYFGKKQGGGQVPANAATKDGNNVFTGTNTFNGQTTFNENLWVLKDKSIKFGWDTGAAKLQLSGVDSTDNGKVVAPIGDLILDAKSGNSIQVQKVISMNNNYIANLHNPDSNQDAATKIYVDNTVAGTFASDLLTTNIKFDNIAIKVKKIPMQTYTAQQNHTLISSFTALLGYTVQRKRNDNYLFYVNPDMNTFQLFKTNNDFTLWVENATNWTNEFEFTFIYI